MSAREHAYASVIVPYDGGITPNAYVPRITAEVRVFFPPNTVTRQQVVDALARAVADALDQIEEKLP